MQHEFYDCLRTGCYISSDIIPRKPLAVWPQLAKTERTDKTYIWQLYIEWKPERRGHVNAARVCDVHHHILLALVEQEAELEVREQEVTDQWLIRTGSRMATPS